MYNASLNDVLSQKGDLYELAYVPSNKSAFPVED